MDVRGWTALPLSPPLYGCVCACVQGEQGNVSLLLGGEERRDSRRKTGRMEAGMKREREGEGGQTFDMAR